MKRAKLLRLIEQVRDETRIEAQRPVTFDNLIIDFEAGTVSFRGRTMKPYPQKAIVIPMLSTDRMIYSHGGEDIL